MALFIQLVVTLAVLLAFVQALTPEQRAQQLLLKMNVTEKLSLLHGHNGVYVGNVVGIDRLGIPALKMQDGPQGFRVTATTGKQGSTTAWPSAMTVAASWDTDVVRRWGEAMGEEFRDKGANVALAPGIGIARVPTAGRNFEYLCGEDPVVGSVLAKEVVLGIQSKGVMANAKHWINNEIESHRMLVSANVDERTRFELYYPPFQAAVDAGVQSVMCSYNRVNDVYACQNEETISHLRDIMGFKGCVLSDWTATKSTVKSLKAGMDMEMPVGVFYNEKVLEKKIASGEVALSDVNSAVLHTLTSMYATGLFDREPSGDPQADVTSDAHRALSREIVAKSTVLLRNQPDASPLLPLDASAAYSCIAVFGDESTVAGGGSGHVTPGYVTTATQGIYAAVEAAGTDVFYNAGTDLAQAKSLAAMCDVSVVVVATSSTEGNDRNDLSLGQAQDDLVSAVASVNKQVIVSVITPGAVLMPWSNSVSAILVNWMPGQDYGSGLADVIFGKVNPSGRLHITMPNKDNEIQFERSQYPGTGFPPEATYSEGLLIGYRWYTAKNVVPKYSFGHGLSYTKFSYGNLVYKVVNAAPQSPSDVVATVTYKVYNTGGRVGTEITQLYVTYPQDAQEPPRQLRAFSALRDIAVDDHVDVTFDLTMRDLSIWDETTHGWKLVPGLYVAYLGSSSADLRMQAMFNF